MKAVVLTGYGDVEKLEFRDVEDPQPGPRQIKVKVAGASVNPVDWKIRRGEMRGMLPLHLPTILGRDVSGEVVGVGRDVTEFEVGDRVMGLVEHGYAELVVASVDGFAKLPREIEVQRAAALPLVGLAGSQLIREGVEARAGERVLVTGAVGSVGRVAVFTAKQRGAQVIAGVRSSQRAQAEKLDVDEIVALDVPEEIKRLRPIDAIADTVNGKAVAALLDRVKPGGIVGTVLGPPLGAKEQGLRVHPILVHPDAERLAELGRAVATGELVIRVERRFPLARARVAQHIAEGGGIGKVLLVPS
ncbi:MAG TPA: NADP-dependent oxidoreductase [Polyangiaceae bacterium]|nr:NADP-dependent oxidoreductase [Polyangiaceae bacterium]